MFISLRVYLKIFISRQRINIRPKAGNVLTALKTKLQPWTAMKNVKVSAAQTGHLSTGGGEGVTAMVDNAFCLSRKLPMLTHVDRYGWDTLNLPFCSS